MIAFNEVTATYHCGLFIEISRTELLRKRITPAPSPFDRKLPSNSLVAGKKYKQNLKKRTTKRNIEEKIEILVYISKNRKRTNTEEKQFNYLDKDIIRIILKAKKMIVGQENT